MRTKSSPWSSRLCLGGIKAGEIAAEEIVPQTPQNSSPSPKTESTPRQKIKKRFKDAPDSGPKKLLTPMFEKQILPLGGEANVKHEGSYIDFSSYSPKTERRVRRARGG